MNSQAESYTGSCHCGGIGFDYYTDQRPANWNIRACQCSFCRAHAALSTSDPAGRIEFKESVEGALMVYRFGKGVTDFLICRNCGVYIGARMSSPHGTFGIINVNALRPIPENIAAPVAMEYGAETAETRIARRERGWSAAG